MTNIPEALEINLDPPPAARPGTIAIIEFVEQGIQAQVLTLATNDTDYDVDLVGWLANQGMLSADGLEAPEGESAMLDQYSDENRVDIEGRTGSLQEQNDSVNVSAAAAFDTTNQTFQDIVSKVETLQVEMSQAPGPGENEQYMPIVAEYALVNSALNTLSEVIDLVDGAQADMESRAEEIDRATPGNFGSPSDIWGAASPTSNAEFTVTGDGTVDDILAIANDEFGKGVHEIGGNTAVYADGSRTPYNINAPWCAAFTSHVWEKAGYQVDWTNPNYVPSIWTDAKSMGLASERNDAAAGDLIIFDWEGDGTPDHIGIVEEVVGNTIYTIEGNSSDKISKREYQMSDADVVGVVKPPPTAEPAPRGEEALAR